MTIVPTQPRRPALSRQVLRFAVVGLTCALIDFAAFQLALHLRFWIPVARAFSFSCGTTAAYFLNSRWTFQVSAGPRRAAGYAVLYGTTFFVIMGANAVALAALPDARWAVPTAWAVSQGFGTTCNFVLLRTVVFRDQRSITSSAAA